jgi:RNA polymerase sigma factor (sigma-70 family)
LAAVPSIGRATRIERPVAPGADAAGDLYERYSSQIFGYCLHQLGSREEAEDAVQTTFMNAFRGLSRGIVPEVESAWLFKIAHNVCLSRRRSSWRRGKVEAPNNFEVLQEIIPGREPVADELISLQDVLEDMPENQRRAILLREWQGLTYREISAELGLTQAAVETLIFRARRSLAQGLEHQGQTSTWKKRARRGADAGSAIACLKVLISGGGAAAVKITASALAVATAALAASSVTPAPKRAANASTDRAAKTRSAGTTAATRTATSTASAQIANAGITSERSRPAARRPARSGAEPTSHPGAATAAAPETQPAAAGAPAATATTPSAAPTTSEPAATPPTPEAKPTETAPAPAPSHGKGKAKGKKDKPDHNTKPTAPPATEPADPTPPSPTGAAWGEPKPDPQPTPPSQESKPDKEGKPDKSDTDHEHGNGKK